MYWFVSDADINGSQEAISYLLYVLIRSASHPIGTSREEIRITRKRSECGYDENRT